MSLALDPAPVPLAAIVHDSRSPSPPSPAPPPPADFDLSELWYEILIKIFGDPHAWDPSKRMSARNAKMRDYIACCLLVVGVAIYLVIADTEISGPLAFATCAIVFIMVYWNNVNLISLVKLIKSLKIAILLSSGVIYTCIDILVRGTNAMQTLSWLLSMTTVIFIDAQRTLVTKASAILGYFLFIAINSYNLLMMFGVLPGWTKQ